LTDERYTLTTTNKERARTARGAHNKVSHAGCKLPSDYLTPAQKKNLSGPVTSFKTNEPMTWATFTALPDSSRRFYIEGLRQKYTAKDNWLARMFGVSDETMRRERERLGIPAYSRGGRAKADEKAAWQAFLDTPEWNLIREARLKAISRKTEETGLANDLRKEAEATEAEPAAEPKPEPEARLTLENVSWADLFAVAKLLGERYGVKVRVEVDT
jgi:hypothetical protein